MYGYRWAYEHCYRMCPRCIAGRWGSVTSTEIYFNKAGPLLGRVMMEVLKPSEIPGTNQTKRKGGAENDGAAPGGVIVSSFADDPQFEEQKEYRLRMGRWRRETYDIVNENNFIWWTVLELNVCLHAPVIHHHNFMAKVFPADKPQHVALMVFGKAHAILAEFEPLFTNGSSWAKELAGRIPHEQAHHLGSLLLLGVELGCNLAAGYDRRVVKPLEQCPLI
jgi:hypothetical protein